jgi:hypothetical protein
MLGIELRCSPSHESSKEIQPESKVTYGYTGQIHISIQASNKIKRYYWPILLKSLNIMKIAAWKKHTIVNLINNESIELHKFAR